jgi:hypothetical protein
MATRRTPLASTKERGYTGEHRRGYAAQREQQWGRPCCRCGRPMIRGQAINKDHLDDRSGYWPTWSHRACNIAASNRRRARLRRQPTATRRSTKAQAEIEPGVWVLWQVPPREHTRGW